MNHKKTRKRRERGLKDYWPVTARWVTVGAMVVYSVTGTKTVNVAYARQPPPPTGPHSPSRKTPEPRRCAALIFLREF